MIPLFTKYPHPISRYIIYSAIFLVCYTSFGCQYFRKSKMKEEFIATRINIIKSKIDDGDLMGAQFDLSPLLNQFPDNPDILTLSGFVDITLGNHKRALDSMLKAHELKPSSGSLLNLSSVYIAQKNYSQAMQTIDQGLQLGRKENYVNIGRFYHNRGYIYELKGQKDLAIQSYKEALYHLPGYLQTLRRLTGIYESRGQIAQAVPYYQRLSYFCRTCFLPMEKLALHYMRVGDRKVAEKMVSSYLKNPQVSGEDKTKARRLQNHILRASKPPKAVSQRGSMNNRPPR